jgi:hypothetical protein
MALYRLTSAECHEQALYAECRYEECRGAVLACREQTAYLSGESATREKKFYNMTTGFGQYCLQRTWRIQRIVIPSV